MDLKNKVVIVSGASSGIGAATAIAFSSQGAKVVLVARNETKLKKVAAQCSNPLVILANVSEEQDTEIIINRTIEKFGQIDVLVNNAGLSRHALLLDSNVMEAYDTIMNVNLRSVFRLTSLAAPYLAKTKGNIINISSVSGLITPVTPGMLIYYVSKAALTHFGRCAAAELSPLGIRVNTVSPGPVKTDFLDNAGAGVDFTWDKAAAATCLKRVSEPEEIADLVLFLASDKAKGITGSDFLTDNGMLIKRV